MSTITILAYMPSGVESYRNCVTDRWSSEFEHFITNEVGEAIQWLGRMKVTNQNQKLGTYQFTILIDGVDEYFWHDEDTEETRDERETLHTRIDQESDAFAKQALDSAQQAKVQQEAAAKLAAEKTRKQAELNALKSKLSPATLEAEQARLRELEAELGA